MSDVDVFSSAPVLMALVAEVIVPPERQRKNARADETLVNSIRENGLINPIILGADLTLIAGERRLDAYRQLGFDLIPYRLWDTLSPLAAHLIELQENRARQNLSWQDETIAIAAYHTLRLADYPAWTQQGTANDIGMTQSNVSKILIVAKHMTDPDILGATTFTGAFNLLEARASRTLAAAEARGLIVGEAVDSVLLTPTGDKAADTDALLAGLDDNIMSAANTTSNLMEKFDAADAAGRALAAAATVERVISSDDRIVQGSFLEWAPSYSGSRFDVLHCDFPYGKNYSGSNTRRTGRATSTPTYADGADIYFALVDVLLAEQDRLLLDSAHIIFWFDMMHYCWTVEQFVAAGWKLVQPFPLVWTKNYQGVASDPARRPRHCYETALLFSRGDRRIRKLDQDIFEMRVPDDKLHMSQKPIEMLKHFLQLVVDEHTAVLDPTCGSGSALAAAGQLGAARVLGIELEESNVDIARFMLKKELPHAT